MNQPKNRRVLFSDLMTSLRTEQVWEYATGESRECREVRQQTHDALQMPEDFPPLAAAIVPGDRIALAVDPNVPQVVDVVRGVIDAISQTEAASVEIVLWDEASDETVQAMTEEVSTAGNVTRHNPSARECLRYLAADESADPIYLNRRLVDADFVLPIVAARPLDKLCSHDLTGIFPALADSATRVRHRDSLWSQPDFDFKKLASELPDIAWLLGLQVVLSVSVHADGNIGQIVAGTPDAIGKGITPVRRPTDEFPPAAPLVIASLDGDAQQQSWTNAARAVASASRFVTPGGTIVLWSEIDDQATSKLIALADQQDQEPDFEPTQEAEFPPWNAATDLAKTFSRIASEYRLLIHSQLDDDSIESMGVGVIGSADELSRLSNGFEACGVLRAAQFTGSTVVAPYGAPETTDE